MALALVASASVALVPAGPGSAQSTAARLIRISTDATATGGAQHATEVEPDAVAWGRDIVAAFQVGRYFDGSAAAIGFSTSGDAGRTWHAEILPSLTETSTPPGPAAFANDPAVAYDAFHRRWLIASLAGIAEQTAVFVSGSADGLKWDPPVTAIDYPRTRFTGMSVDKEWITRDNGTMSPFRGRCYLAYTDLAHRDPIHPGNHLAIQSSTDGGRTWSGPVLLNLNVPSVLAGVQPVVRPNGELVMAFVEYGVVEAVRSSDGAATFSERERVSGLTVHARPFDPPRLRSPAVPTATVDADGTVYVAWHDCRFRVRCFTDDIVLTRSAAPGRWTTPRRVRLSSLRSRTEFAIADLAADPTSRGSRARLALTYYAASSSECAQPTCSLDVFLVTSTSAGARWSKPRRLNPRPMRFGWLAQTADGRMVGDYVATVFSGPRVVSVHTQARAPKREQLDEAIYSFSQTLRRAAAR